jgi:hypothetical protein
MNAEDLVTLALDSRASILQPVEPYFPVAHGNVLLEPDCERPCFHDDLDGNQFFFNYPSEATFPKIAGDEGAV